MAKLQFFYREKDNLLYLMVMELDTTYPYDDRTCTVKVKKSDENTWYNIYSPSSDGYNTTIEAGASEFAIGYVSAMKNPYGGNLIKFQPNTEYTFKVEISYTDDTDGGTTKISTITSEYVFGDVVPEIDAEVPELPDIELKYPPTIVTFDVWQPTIGVKKIKYDVLVKDLVQFVNDKTFGYVVFQYRKQNEDKWTIIENGDNWSSEYLKGTIVDKSGTRSVPDFGEYEFKITAENVWQGSSDDIYESIERVISVKVLKSEEEEEAPKCTLNCIFQDEYYSFDDGRVTGTIKDYPHITADAFNQFRADINTVRDKAISLTYNFGNPVSKEDPMTVEIWQDILYAIYAMDESLGMPYILSNYKITPDFINKIEIDLQTIRDRYWT